MTLSKFAGEVSLQPRIAPLDDKFQFRAFKKEMEKYKGTSKRKTSDILSDSEETVLDAK